MESHTFEMTTSEQTFTLSEPIDNRSGDYCMSLNRSIFTVGFFNISQRMPIGWRIFSSSGDTRGEMVIPAGNYDIDRLVAELDKLNIIKVTIDKINRKLYFRVNRINLNIDALITFDEYTQKVLGLPRASWITKSGEMIGDYSMNYVNTVFLHCKQLSTSHNFYNGEKTDLLDVIPIENINSESDIIATNQNQRKTTIPLVRDSIHQLSFSIRDSNRKLIDNHGKKVVLRVDIYKNSCSNL